MTPDQEALAKKLLAAVSTSDPQAAGKMTQERPGVAGCHCPLAMPDQAVGFSVPTSVIPSGQGKES